MTMQSNWRFCEKCMGLFFAGGATNGACPAGGAHGPGGAYSLVNNVPNDTGQRQWRFCKRCMGLFFAGRGTNGVCPAGGAHDPSQSGDYSLVNNVPSDTGQHQWQRTRVALRRKT